MRQNGIYRHPAGTVAGSVSRKLTRFRQWDKEKMAPRPAANNTQAFGHDAAGFGKTKFAENSQPFMAGNNATQISKSRQGR